LWREHSGKVYRMSQVIGLSGCSFLLLIQRSNGMFRHGYFAKRWTVAMVQRTWSAQFSI
jgi:hypothetical protein